MWKSSQMRRAVIGVGGVVAGVALFFICYNAALYFIPSFRLEVAIAPCHAEKDNVQQVECIFRVISKEMRKHGVGAAMETFSAAYRDFPSFIAVSCHVHAHRVGDMAYYDVYAGTKSLASLDFPQSTTACGYGFYHGFLEHLIQNHPDPAFVTSTCEYLTDRLGKDMRDIERICYHGSGHGFLLAEAAHADKSEWGNINAFTEKPIALCGSLTKANATDKEECVEGIFNVLAEWMWLKQYGFVEKKETLFSNCIGVPEAAQKACYYEMAQKIPGYTNNNPMEVQTFISQIANKKYRDMAFQVGVAGIISSVLTEGSAYIHVSTLCDGLDDTHYSSCVDSVIAGLYEHGEPQEEYKKALVFCSEDPIAAHHKLDFCYQTVALRMPRFYSPRQIVGICKEFPLPYQHYCQNLSSN